jgi:protein-S-isoprenylcysteine O-methyltransferase Ste14
MKFVVSQFVLMAAIAVAWFLPPHAHHRAVGIALVLAGFALATWARVALGASFTVNPHPRGPLVTSGPYRVLRHPMYVAGLLVFGGISLAHSWTALALTGVLAVLWWRKSRLEERYLLERFPEYADVRRRTLF